MNTKTIILPELKWQIELKERLSGKEVLEIEALHNESMRVRYSKENAGGEGMTPAECIRKLRIVTMNFYIQSAKNEKGEHLPIGESLVKKILESDEDDYLTLVNAIEEIKVKREESKKKLLNNSEK